MTLRPLFLLGLATALVGCPYVGERRYNDDIRDFDGDGGISERFGGPDCRDDDPSIANCDEDGDGVRSVAAGGEDCDDNNVDVVGLITWYRDADEDGFGDAEMTAEACAAPAGFIAVAGDCDDSRADVHPASNEFCDLVDHNCDGDLDFNAVDMLTYFIDGDGDGYGRNELSTSQGCPGDAPVGTSATNDDCDDLDADVHPNAADTWYDGVDSDCAGDDDYDQDGDGAAFRARTATTRTARWARAPRSCATARTTTATGASTRWPMSRPSSSPTTTWTPTATGPVAVNPSPAATPPSQLGTWPMAATATTTTRR